MSASIHDSPLPVTNHRLDIQGLRAVAVIAVILYHADDLLPGGFVGVDVFFVISGFVIMRSLAREHARTSAINLADFYRRRIRRLTPVLALTIIVVVPLSILLGPISSVDFGARTGVAATFLSANMYLARNGGYFATAAELNPLNHTWSLSLEEQFYLVFPAVVSFLYWRSTRGQQVHRGIALGLLCLSLVSLGLALFMSYGPGLGPIEASTLRHYSFFVMPARAWQFGAGALLAILLASDDYRFAKPGHGAVGGALVVACFLAFNDGLNYPGAWALVPTVGSVLLLANPKSVFLGFLSTLPSSRWVMSPTVGISGTGQQWCSHVQLDLNRRSCWQPWASECCHSRCSPMHESKQSTENRPRVRGEVVGYQSLPPA